MEGGLGNCALPWRHAERVVASKDGGDLCEIAQKEGRATLCRTFGSTWQHMAVACSYMFIIFQHFQDKSISADLKLKLQRLETQKRAALDSENYAKAAEIKKSVEVARCPMSKDLAV